MERNMIGELNMYKEAGIKPNFSDIGRRYGKDRHTVAAYWNADGCDLGDGRSERESAFEPHRAEIEEKAALPGVTKKGIHEFLLHRYPEEELVAIIARIEERCNAEVNETTGMPPSVLFMDEKESLRPIGNMRALEEAMGDVVDVPEVPATMLVSAHGRKVSVPRRCIGRAVRLVCMPDGGIDCYMAGRLVASHAPGASGYDPAHYAEAMEGKRWFGDADIEDAAAANLELLSAIGGRL